MAAPLATIDRQAASSYFGIVDTCGLPKDRFYLYRSYWRPDDALVHILPHWNWPERVGLPVPVFVYTNGDSAELFLNGKSLGRRLVPDGRELHARDQLPFGRESGHERRGLLVREVERRHPDVCPHVRHTRGPGGGAPRRE